MTQVSGDWLSCDSTQHVLGVLEAGGHEAYVVGGCVRNALMDVAVGDVDIATNARPERVVLLAERAGLKAVPTGIEHGTVTVVADGVGHEVTTYRADVETDGRRAVVRYADDVAEDAARRDFTMNALYADARGRVLDPLGGLPDLEARRVRFIGDAGERIREDYLRILRFFRFIAWYGDPAEGVDAEALAGIAANLEGLQKLSAERVGHEMVRLLRAPEPEIAVCVMAQSGVLDKVLPGASILAIQPLIALEQGHGLAPDPMRRLAGLGYYDGASLRLSRGQQKRLELYQSLLSSDEPIAETAWRHGAEIALDVAILRAASLGQPVAPFVHDEIAKGAGAKFPVKPRDLMPGLQGPELGEALRRLERRWIASGFTLTRDDLLQ